MTVGSTSVGEISQPKGLPKPSLRAAHTVVSNYSGPFRTFESFNRCVVTDNYNSEGDFHVLRKEKRGQAAFLA